MTDAKTILKPLSDSTNETVRGKAIYPSSKKVVCVLPVFKTVDTKYRSIGVVNVFLKYLSVLA